MRRRKQLFASRLTTPARPLFILVMSSFNIVCGALLKFPALAAVFSASPLP
jgi:hypothetical protein